MQLKQILKTGMITATLAGLMAPTLATAAEADQGERRGNSRADAYRSGDRGGDRSDRGNRGGGDRGRPASSQSRQVDAPSPPPRVQSQVVPRPGTREWYAERGINAPNAQPQPQPGNPAGNPPPPSSGRPDRDGGRGNDWRGNDNRGGDRNDRDRRDNDRRDWNDNRGGGRPDWNDNRNDRDRDRRDWNDNRGNDRNNWNNNRGNDNWRYQDGRRIDNRWNGVRRWDNDWRRDRRYDWQDYRRLNRSIFRLPRYYAPYGWTRGYSRFSIGFYLNSVLFSTSYWIDDPWRYRLPPAYGPLRWVRYYDDALLVDIRDGYVVDVIYDVFW